MSCTTILLIKYFTWYQNVFTWKKPYINFISRKYYKFAFVVLTHVMYSEVYNHQLFIISINFTHKFCYWHRRKSSRIFLRKSCSERFGKISKSLFLQSATFIWLYFDRQQIYKNQASSWMLPAVFENVLINASDHLWVATPESNRLM